MTAETLITTPFGFDSIAAEVITGIDLTGKRAIVTGGSSGIGIRDCRCTRGRGRRGHARCSKRRSRGQDRRGHN